MIIEVLTAILVFITGFYAWATYEMLKANRKVIDVMEEQYESTTRPYVVAHVTLEPDNPIIYLVIKNTGKSTASNLKLTLDRPFYQFAEDDKNLQDYTAFSKVIESFPPESELIFPLAQGFVIFGEKGSQEATPTKFEITAEYSYSESSIHETHQIDLRPYLNTSIPQDPYVRKLKDIKESLDRIASK